MQQITVIIPIHNSERYLKECIKSALTQNFQELEILCIDGGSTDRSEEIIKQLQKEDDRLIFIQDPNTSYGHKINIGIKRAKGNYIAILESDDKMEPDMIEQLYNVAQEYNTDIVDADYYEFLNYRGNELRSHVCKYADSENYDRLIEYGNKAERDIATNGIWTGLYKKSFIMEHSIWLNESRGASYQDLSFLFLTSFLAKRVYHINLPLYQYRVDNPQSSVKDGHKIFEIVKECEFLKEALLKRGIKNDLDWRLYYIRKYNAFYWNYCRLSEAARDKFLVEYIRELKRDVKNRMIDRSEFSTLLYDRTFLLLDDKKEFIEKTQEITIQSFLARICEKLERIDEQDIVIFGIGIRGLRIVDILMQNKNNITAICDNSQTNQGTYLHGLKIVSVKEAVKEFPGAVYIITSNKFRKEMLNQLLNEGIKIDNIVIIE